jgi:hypothetical protein
MSSIFPNTRPGPPIPKGPPAGPWPRCRFDPRLFNPMHRRTFEISAARAPVRTLPEGPPNPSESAFQSPTTP